EPADEAEAPEGPTEAFPEEWIERLPALIASVSPASRAVLILHYREGLSLDEVAAVLDLSPGTVKSRLAYGLRSLRRAVGCGDTSPARKGIPDGRTEFR